MDEREYIVTLKVSVVVFADTEEEAKREALAQIKSHDYDMLDADFFEVEDISINY